MNGKEFLDSKWCKDAASPQKQTQIKESFGKWTTRVGNSGLLSRAKQLYEFFLSSEISGTKKVVVAGALLYIITPIDIIPDFIPVAGWLDDLGIASFALSYIFSQMDKIEKTKENQGIAACSTEDLLEKEITGTNEDNEWCLKVHESSSKLTDNHQSMEIKKKIDELSEITDLLSIEDADHYLGKAETKLEANRIMSVVVVGRYSTGKSTLINALLGKNILPSSPIPTTKAVTYLLKGNAESLYMENDDGEIIVQDSFDNFSIQKDKDISSAKKITISLPDFPFDNISFIDTPGLEEPDQSIAQLTLNAIPDADAIVVVMDANYLQSKVEFEFISSLLKNDKERKLFIVINKVDGKSSAQIKDLETMCHSLLIEHEVPHAGVYAISAIESEEDAGFVKFKDALFEFLLNDIQAEVYNHLNNELSSYASLLKDSCESKLELAAKNEQERNLVIANNRNRAESITEEYEKQKRKLSGKFRQYKDQFVLDFSFFIDSLKVSVQQEINTSSWEKLKNTEDLAKRIKQEIVSFVDTNTAEINEKLYSVFSDSQTQIRSYLAQLQIQLDGNVKDYSSYAGLFMPAVVLVSFTTCGFLTFVWTIIAAMIGRNFFESSIASALSTVGIKGAKEKLTEQVLSNINKIKVDLISQFETSFSAIEKDISSSFDQAGRCAAASVSGLIENNAISRESITDCRNRLQKITL